MAKVKAKWLEEATGMELLDMVKEILEGDLEKKDVNKATKAIEEVIERTPIETDEIPSVEEAIAALGTIFAEGIAAIGAAYNSELEAMEEEDFDDEEPEDLDDEEEEELDNGYEDMTMKELKAECKEKGIKGLKGLKKDDIIALLEDADDEEEEDDYEEEEEEEEEEDIEEDDIEDEDLPEYEDMTAKDLKAECRERGIKVKKGMKKPDLIEALEADDED